MKTTTHIIIAAIVAGAIATGVFAAYLVDFGQSINARITIEGDSLVTLENITLPDFKTIIVNRSVDRWSINSSGKVSLSISESDTITKPYLTVPVGLKRYVKTSCSGDSALTICLDYAGDNFRKGGLEISVPDTHIKIAVPRGSLKRVETVKQYPGFKDVIITGFKNQSLDMDGCLKTTLVNCDLTTLTVTDSHDERSYESLNFELEKTHIAKFDMCDMIDGVGISGDGESTIDSVDASATSMIDMLLQVSLCKIGHINWDGGAEGSSFSVKSEEPFHAVFQ